MPCSEARRRGAAALLAPLLLSCAALSVSEERRIGPAYAAAVRREYVFLNDRVVEAYVQEIGRDILRAAGPQPFEYHFAVVEDPDINAFAGPAGYIYLHTGTLLEARNVGELAGVIAHEIGHVARRHVAQNYGRARGARLGRGVLVAAAAVAGGGLAANAASLGSGLAAMAYLNRFGREAEMEADDFAVEVLPRAGYDPVGLLTFFETLRRKGGPGVPGFLSSHPTTEERIARTRARIAALPATPGLRSRDGGRFEIIQSRIRLLTEGR